MAFAYAGAALWASCFLTLGYVVGDSWHVLVADLHHKLLDAFLVLVALAGAYMFLKARRR